MALIYKHKHHRNPSGCHNKVRWLLSLSKYDIKKLKRWLKRKGYKLINNQLQNGKQSDSWADAITIAKCYLLNMRLPYTLRNKYYWALEYDQSHLYTTSEGEIPTELIWHDYNKIKPSYNQKDFRRFIFICCYSGIDIKLRGRKIPIVIDDWHKFFKVKYCDYTPIYWAELPRF